MQQDVLFIKHRRDAKKMQDQIYTAAVAWNCDYEIHISEY